MANKIGLKEKLKIFFTTHLGAWVAVVFVMGVIFYYSSLTQPLHGDDLSLATIVRKLGHLFEFGVLQLAIFNLYQRYKIRVSKSLVFSLSLTFLYSITDELHQSFTFGRHATYRDVVIDMAGALIAAWLIALFVDKKQS